MTTCLTCLSGFKLSGNRCLNINFISVDVEFTPDNADNSFFNDNYNTIMTGLANASSVDIGHIIVIELIYGSIEFKANVTTTTTPGSAEDQQIQDKIMNYFDTTTFNGLTVKVLSINNPNTPSSNGGSDSNTTLIIAIVVPIVSVRTSIFI